MYDLDRWILLGIVSIASDFESYGLSFQVLESELTCKSYKSSNGRFVFSKNDHISISNYVNNIMGTIF